MIKYIYIIKIQNHIGYNINVDVFTIIIGKRANENSNNNNYYNMIVSIILLR